MAKKRNLPVEPVPGKTIRLKHEQSLSGDRTHYGVCYEVEEDEAVNASAGGRVVMATKFAGKERIEKDKRGKIVKRFDGAYGNVVVLYHGIELDTLMHVYTLYAHLSTISVSVGKQIHKNRFIGFTGRTGTKKEGLKKKKNDKYHLHFEVIKCRKELNWTETARVVRDRELYRKDPEDFLSRTLEAVIVGDLIEHYRVDLSNGTTLAYYKDAIYYNNAIYIRRFASGDIIKIVNKGELPYKKAKEFFWKMVDTLKGNVGREGEHMHPGFSASAEDLRSNEELKNWKIDNREHFESKKDR